MQPASPPRSPCSGPSARALNFDFGSKGSASFSKTSLPAMWWEAQNLALPVCTLAGGPPVARHLATTSRAFYQAVSEAWEDLMARFPCRLYVVGGLDSSYRAVGTLERFDPLTDSWDSLPGLAVPRAGPCAAVSAGRLYVLGGELNGHALSDAQRFDPWLGHWENLPPMSVGRIRAAAISCGGYLYVLGGLDGSRPLNAVERYEPLSRTWETVAPMKRARYTCVAVVHGHYIFAFGGELADVGTTASIERFDTHTGQWELMSTTVRAPRCGAALTLANAGRAAFSIGGLGLSGQALGVADRINFDLSLLEPQAGDESLQWEPLPAMNTPRHLTTATSFRGGAIAIGGKGSTFEAVSDVELFDPDVWAWETLPSLPSPRLRAAAVSGRL